MAQRRSEHATVEPPRRHLDVVDGYGKIHGFSVSVFVMTPIGD
jgi:hypothetical protein